MGDDEEDADFNEIVNIYVEAYIKGMEIMRILQVSYAEIYQMWIGCLEKLR